MPRRFVLWVWVAMAVAWLPCGPAWAAPGELVPETTLARSGLTRSWSLQAELDRSRTHVTNVALFEGVLYVQTDAATVQAIDAETGRTLWSKQVGTPSSPSMPLDARGDWVAVVNGSRLFLLRRTTGEIIRERLVRDAPGGGPGLSTKRVYVPNVTGMVIAYPLPASREKAGAASKSDSAGAEKIAPNRGGEDSGAAPLLCQSLGRALVQPLVTRDFIGGEYVVWPSDRGYLHFGRIERETENLFGLKYRLGATAAIVARAAYLPPDPTVLGDAGIVFSASNDGFLYAVQEETGELLWRFSTGDVILQSPAVVDNRVYITTDGGTMYCLTAKHGKVLWSADNLVQFVAAGKTRVYASDSFGRLQVLNAANGSRLDAVPVDAAFKVMNTDTDRMYFVGQTGLVQCLREIEQTEPVMHGKERKEAAKIEAKRLVQQKSSQPKKVADEDKPAKKEAVAPKATTPPKERPTPKKKEPKQPKTPKKPGKKATNGNAPLNPAGKGVKGKKPKNDNRDPF